MSSQLVTNNFFVQWKRSVSFSFAVPSELGAMWRQWLDSCTRGSIARAPELPTERVAPTFEGHYAHTEPSKQAPLDLYEQQQATEAAHAVSGAHEAGIENASAACATPIHVDPADAAWRGVAEAEHAREAVLQVVSADGSTLLWSSSKAAGSSSQGQGAGAAKGEHYLRALLGPEYDVGEVLRVLASGPGSTWSCKLRLGGLQQQRSESNGGAGISEGEEGEGEEAEALGSQDGLQEKDDEEDEDEDDGKGGRTRTGLGRARLSLIAEGDESWVGPGSQVFDPTGACQRRSLPQVQRPSPKRQAEEQASSPVGTAAPETAPGTSLMWRQAVDEGTEGYMFEGDLELGTLEMMPRRRSDAQLGARSKSMPWLHMPAGDELAAAAESASRVRIERSSSMFAPGERCRPSPKQLQLVLPLDRSSFDSSRDLLSSPSNILARPTMLQAAQTQPRALRQRGGFLATSGAHRPRPSLELQYHMAASALASTDSSQPLFNTLGRMPRTTALLQASGMDRMLSSYSSHELLPPEGLAGTSMPGQGLTDEGGVINVSSFMLATFPGPLGPQAGGLAQLSGGSSKAPAGRSRLGLLGPTDRSKEARSVGGRSASPLHSSGRQLVSSTGQGIGAGGLGDARTHVGSFSSAHGQARISEANRSYNRDMDHSGIINEAFMSTGDFIAAALADQSTEAEICESQQGRSPSSEQEPASLGSVPLKPSPAMGAPAEPPSCVMEVSLRAIRHPVTQQQALLLTMKDITSRTTVEDMLAELTENQLGMIAQMLPRHIIEFLAFHSKGPAAAAAAVGQLPHKGGGGLQSVPANIGRLARSHQDVTLFFMDIIGFTSMSKEVEPWQVMAFLNTFFSHLDELVVQHGVHKVETAGDCYIVSAGVVEEGPDGFMQVLEAHDPQDSARRVMAFAKAVLQVAQMVPMPNSGLPVRVRIGLHTGPCTSGLIGTKLPKYSIFGDSMNTASRMESTSQPGRIQASATTHALLPEEHWEATGGVEVKGKGLMETFLWVGPPAAESPGSHSEGGMAAASDAHSTGYTEEASSWSMQADPGHVQPRMVAPSPSPDAPSVQQQQQQQQQGTDQAVPAQIARAFASAGGRLQARRTSWVSKARMSMDAKRPHVKPPPRPGSGQAGSSMWADGVQARPPGSPWNPNLLFAAAELALKVSVGLQQPQLSSGTVGTAASAGVPNLSSSQLSILQDIHPPVHNDNNNNNNNNNNNSILSSGISSQLGWIDSGGGWVGPAPPTSLADSTGVSTGSSLAAPRSHAAHTRAWAARFIGGAPSSVQVPRGDGALQQEARTAPVSNDISSSMQLADLLNSTTMQPGQQQQQEQAWRDAPLVSAVNTPSPDTTPPTRSHSPKVGSGGLGVTAAAGLHLPVTALLGTPVAGAHVTGPVAASEGSPARKRHGSSSGAGPHVSPECASRQQVAPSAWAEGSVDGVQSRGRRGSSRTGLGMLSLAPLLQAANWSVGEDAAGAHGATHAAGLAAARGSSRMRPL